MTPGTTGLFPDYHARSLAALLRELHPDGFFVCGLDKRSAINYLIIHQNLRTAKHICSI